MNDKLNKFITYEYLKKTLKNGLHFSDGEKWLDKNDKELLDLFNSKSGKEARVVCLMQEDETIYHWQSFAYDSCEQEVCCIEFDKEMLLSLYDKKDGIVYGDVEYKSIDEVVYDEPKKLLFTKRLPYRYEKEYRIVYVSADKNELLKPNIDEFRKCITKISMSGRLSQKQYKHRKAYLIKEFSLLDSQINQSTIERNPIWINKAKVQSIYLNYTKDEVSQLKRICAKTNKSEDNYQVKVERYSSSKIHSQSTVVTIQTDGYVIAMGAIHILDEKRINEIKEKYHFKIGKCSDFFELGCFFVRDDYVKKDLLKQIVAELLKYYESEAVVSIAEVGEKEVQAVLTDAGFQQIEKRKKNILFRK